MFCGQLEEWTEYCFSPQSPPPSLAPTPVHCMPMCVSGFVFEDAVESGKGLRNEKKIQCFDRWDGRRLEPLRKKKKEKEKRNGWEGELGVGGGTQV